MKMYRKSARKQGKILGIGVDSTSVRKVLAYVKYRIESGKKFSIVTPNPEIVLASIADPDLKKSLNKADLVLPDGVGLAFAAAFLRVGPLKILPGRKVFLALVSLANKNSWRVFLLGGENSLK